AGRPTGLARGLAIGLAGGLTIGFTAGLTAGLTPRVAFGVAIGASVAGLAGLAGLVGLAVLTFLERSGRRGELTHPFARRRGAAGASAIRPWSQACTWVDRLVGYLVDSSVRRLPEVLRDRYVEEWADHRTRLRGLRLVWWAMC